MDIPVIWQYVIYGAVAFLGVVLLLYLYNRREKRRKHALELSRLMAKWGLDWFAEGYDMYAVGDYSGLAYKIKEIVQAVRSDEEMVRKLVDVSMNVAKYAKDNDEALAAKFAAALGYDVS